MRIPKYRCQKLRNIGFVEWQGRRYYLPGSFNSDESLTAYRTFLRDNCLESPVVRASVEAAEGPLSMLGLSVSFLDHARVYYPAKRKSEYGNFRFILNRLLNTHVALPANSKGEVDRVKFTRAFPLTAQSVDLDELEMPSLPIGRLAALEFSAPILKWYRNYLPSQRAIKTQKKARYDADGKEIPQPPVLGDFLTRSYINKSIKKIRAVFSWAVSEGMIKVAVLEELKTVKALAKGRTNARETEKRKPVEREYVDAILPFLSPQHQDMVRLQLYTGVRGDSVCQALPEQFTIDRGKNEDGTAFEMMVWRPIHKTEFAEVVAYHPIGPEAMEIVERYLKLALGANTSLTPNTNAKTPGIATTTTATRTHKR
ncbi:MAG: hypothetical protein QM811_22620 [Pirellulales bacterium]